jgi:hypothetical protein
MTFTQRLGQWLGLSQAEGPGIAREVPPRQWRPVLHPGFTIAGTQPTVVIPQASSASCTAEMLVPRTAQAACHCRVLHSVCSMQRRITHVVALYAFFSDSPRKQKQQLTELSLIQVTGDILSLTTDIGGPVLPGFGPTAFAARANAATGLAAATAVAGLGSAGRVGGSSAGSAAADAAAASSMPQAVVDFLMPPQAINADIVSQVRAWHHSNNGIKLCRHCCCCCCCVCLHAHWCSAASSQCVNAVVVPA